MKKKIMHIAQSAGGVDKYIQMLVSNTDRDNIDNILVCSFDFNKENYEGKVTAFEQVDMIREINPVSDLKAILNVRKLIKKYKPDYVYMHSSKAGAIGRVANIGLKNKVLYNPHGWAFNMECSSKKKTIYRSIERILASLTDTIVAISNAEKKSALDNKICNENKIEVIFNGIDIKRYDEKKYSLTRKDLGIPEDAYVIGSVGRLSKQKAPDVFVRAAKQIKEEIPEAFFLWVGDGEDRSEIEKLIKELNLEDSFIIVGWINDAMEYIRLFDQAMLLSRWEGFGLVLAEYMMANKPIIATRVDAIPDLITDMSNGILVDVDNAERAYEASLKIYNDIKLSKRIAEKGNEVVREKFDIKRVVEQHNKLWK